MGISFNGIVIGLATFFTIGCFHPLVIKAEYYLGTKSWVGFMIFGVVSLIWSLFIENIIGASIVGVVGFSCFWSILEVFQQKGRVERGWFPMNPERKDEYPPDCEGRRMLDAKQTRSAE
ncbi:MAG: DUF4491 family protein [Paludibacteraceae bacterium]|nr:DUF4491 family protein [Paludibacteraceae bacterium]